MAHDSLPANRLVSVVAFFALLPACGEQELTQLRTRVQSLEKENMTLQAEISSLRTNATLSEQTIRDKEHLIAQMRTEIAATNEALSQARVQLDRFRTDQSDLIARYDQKLEALNERLIRAAEAKTTPAKQDSFKSLIRSLQTLQSGTETGIDQPAYVKLIETARAELISLDRESARHPITGKIHQLLDSHQTLAAVWSQFSKHNSTTIRSRSQPELYESMLKYFPTIQPSPGGGGELIFAVTIEQFASRFWVQLALLWREILEQWQDFE